MVTKAELERVRSLHQRKHREQERMFLVQGRKLVGELLDSSFRTAAIYATEAGAGLMRAVDVVVLPDHQLDKLGTLESGNEVVALVHMPPPPTSAPLGKDELVLAMDGVSDPGNLGTVLRIADWFGVKRVLLGRNSVDPFNPKTVQASMGAIFRVQVQEVDLATRLTGLANAGAMIYKAEMDGTNVFHTDLERPAVLVLGSESHGLSAEVRAVPGSSIAIPRSGGSESLNVAMAASALCMEFTRRSQ